MSDSDTAAKPASGPSAPEPSPDEEIVRRVLDGDATLFEILMRRHNQRIYRAVRAVLGEDTEVEDVMQQAYLNAYQHLRQYAGEAKFSTWLTRIAVNEASHRLRSRHRLQPLDNDEVIMALPDLKHPDPEASASAAELREVLEKEVASLPHSFRAVLVLREVEGLSTAETAASLDISEDLVKTRLHRARTMLRDRLYSRVGSGMSALFTFGNARCDRVVAGVMAIILD